MNTQKTVFNPFEGRDPNEVWEEIRKNSKPTTRIKALKEISSIIKKNRSK